MALINTLRNKMGKVVVGVIAFSIFAFVGADLVGPNSTLLGNNSNDVGEIAGITISRDDFQGKVDEMSRNFAQSTRRNPSSAELVSLRNQAWDALIAEIAYKRQFSNVGLDVSQEEVIDMVQGDNISPDIRQAFTNPETGQFDKEQVIGFLQNLGDQPAAQRANWYSFERNLAPSRLRIKYENLLLSTNYATEAEAKQEYMNTASTADVKYAYVPYITVSDSVVSFTEGELNNYLNDHEDEYQRDASRAIQYVMVSVEPSSADSASVKKEVEALKQQLAETENDSTFASLNSDSGLPFVTYNRGTIPEVLVGDNGELEVGQVVGPVLANGKYTLYKMSQISEGAQSSARANHILFKWNDESSASKAKTKAEAKKVLRSIRNGADFAEMARIHGTDGSASKGGDLGWFSDGQMTPVFQKAVYAAKRTGLLRDVVETQFGYHIIDVTETKTNLSYKVAKVEVELFSSDETRNNFYREAELFAVNSGNMEEFERNAEESSLEIVKVERVGKNDRRLTRLADGRGVVSWLYNTATTGKISNVFEIDNVYVIAAMTGEQEEGVAGLESVRNEVESKVKNQKKATYLIDKLNGMTGSIEEVAEAYGTNAKVYNMDGLKLSSNSLTGVGIAPEAIGLAFSMENGEKTTPFEITNGVVILEMVNKIQPGDISDYDAYRSQIVQKRQSRAAFNIDKTVKELAGIVDERYRFF